LDGILLVRRTISVQVVERGDDWADLVEVDVQEVV
jgi:hypothetical protein